MDVPFERNLRKVSPLLTEFKNRDVGTLFPTYDCQLQNRIVIPNMNIIKHIKSRGKDHLTLEESWEFLLHDVFVFFPKTIFFSKNCFTSKITKNLFQKHPSHPSPRIPNFRFLKQHIICHLEEKKKLLAATN